MSLLARAIAWFLAYVALISAPLLVAALSNPFEGPRPFLLEASVALGFIAIPVILAQFALVSHLRAASRPFGTDALVQFHRYMGFASLVFVLAHPLLLNITGVPWSAWSPLSANPVTQSGAIAVWALVALVVTSVFRRGLRMSYEVWRVVHLLLGIAAVVAILLHIVAVSGYTSILTMQVLLFLYGVAFGSVLVAYRFIRPLWLHRRSWTVVANADQGAGVRALRVRPDRRGFSFDPGVDKSRPWPPQPAASTHTPRTIDRMGLPLEEAAPHRTRPGVRASSGAPGEQMVGHGESRRL